MPNVPRLTYLAVASPGTAMAQPILRYSRMKALHLPLFAEIAVILVESSRLFWISVEATVSLVFMRLLSMVVAISTMSLFTYKGVGICTVCDGPR
jgi:hypothetical protein